MNKNFCIIGSGIIGLSSAQILALNYPGCSITILSEKFPPDTLSDNSFGSIWWPEASIPKYFSPKDGERSLVTFNKFYEIIKNNHTLAKAMGIQINKGYHIIDKKHGTKELDGEMFKKTSVDFRKATKEEIEKEGFLDRATKFKVIFGRDNVVADDIAVYKYGMLIIDTKVYLPWLITEMRNMEKRNMIHMKKEKVTSLKEVCERGYDLVVNCSGLGAKKLTNDKKVTPIKGQFLVCKKLSDDFPFYGHSDPFVCPMTDRVLVGVVFQIGIEDAEVDSNNTQMLIEKNVVLWPEVTRNILKVETGIRPARLGGARLEAERIQLNFNGKSAIVIHNYGHGSKGVMTHIGCALEVLKLYQTISHSSKL